MTDSHTPATIEVLPPAAATAMYTRDQVDLLKRTLANGELTDDEFALFMETARQLGANPLKRQISVQKRNTRDGSKLVIISEIGYFRAVADATGHYEGQLGPYWCGPDGQWRDVWLDDGPPAAARTAVYKAGFREPLWAVAHWAEFRQTYKDRQGNEVPTDAWRRMPALMLAKCSEAAALRRAFPQQLSTVYTSDEMDQADNPPPTVETHAVVPRETVNRMPRPTVVDAGTVGPAMITAKQLGKIQAVYRDAGITDRAERLTITTALLHRELDGNALETTKVLTAREASTLIDQLTQLADTGPTLRDAYETQAAQAVVDREGELADARAAEEEAASADADEAADRALFHES